MTPEFRLRDRDKFVRPPMSPRFTVPAAAETAPPPAEMPARFVAPEAAPTFAPGAFGVPDALPRFEVPAGPPPPPPPTPYQQAVDRYRTLRATPAVDENGRPLSGLGNALLEAGAAARRSGSLGQAAGAGIVGLLAGLINPKGDEERKKLGEEAKALDVVKGEAALEAQARDALKETAGVKLTEAQTAAALDQPVFRREEAERKSKEFEGRLGVLETDAETRRKAAEESARKNRETEADRDAERERKAQAAKDAADLKRELQKNDSELKRELARMRADVDRARVAASRDNAGLASSDRAAERERKSKEFSARYPGAGKELSAADAVERGAKLGLKPAESIRRAAGLGYDIKF